MNKGIGICCADIYLEFPELMEEEFIELCNFLDDEHIRYTGATERFKESEIKINQLNSKIYGKDEYIKILEKENDRLKSGIYKILKLNEYMIHCESKEVIYKFLMKQWRTIYETLGIPEPGLARCSKNDLESKGE